MLVGGFSLTVSTRDSFRETRSQVVLDPANLSQAIIDLLETLTREGSFTNGLTQAFITAEQSAQFKEMIESFEKVLNTVMLAARSLEDMYYLYDLLKMLNDDVEFFTTVDNAYQSDDVFAGIVANINMVTTYTNIVNFIINTAYKEIKNFQEFSSKDQSYKDVVEYFHNVVINAYSTYYSVRSMYMNRYLSRHYHYCHRAIAIGNDKFVTLII